MKNLFYLLSVSVFILFVTEGYGLKCKECADPDQPSCSTVKDVDCDVSGVGFDTCLTFTGKFVDENGKNNIGSTIRSCGQVARLQEISKEITAEKCINVKHARDTKSQSKRPTATGRFCLCSTDYCNAPNV